MGYLGNGRAGIVEVSQGVRFLTGLLAKQDRPMDIFNSHPPPVYNYFFKLEEILVIIN